MSILYFCVSIVGWTVTWNTSYIKDITELIWSFKQSWVLDKQSVFGAKVQNRVKIGTIIPCSRVLTGRLPIYNSSRVLNWLISSFRLTYRIEEQNSLQVFKLSDELFNESMFIINRRLPHLTLEIQSYWIKTINPRTNIQVINVQHLELFVVNGCWH